ncbi:hypothetical protein HAX54_008641, partial [Datura stramonium]|nr:hypothetical protein [Datura stramonium]
MANYPSIKVQLSFLISFVINIVLMTNASTFDPSITERFISSLPQNTPLLEVHCKSLDDDIGVRTLKVGDQFDFSFHENFWDTTHFHCTLTWGSKNSEFD